MKFLTDSFYRIGNSHEVCQDYALAGTTHNGIPYAIVCDGCSSSTGVVDFGARIVAHALVHIIEDVGHNKYAYDNVCKFVVHDMKKYMHNARHDFDLTPEDFLVTIEAVFVWDNMVFRIKYGDGVHMEDMQYKNLEFTSNAPFYLAYDVFDMREGYDYQFGSYPIHAYDGEGHISMHLDSYLDCERYGTVEPLSFASDGRCLLAVSTDGLKSFSLADVPCDLQWVTDEVMSIKNTNFGFVKRRMKKFLSKETLTHYDDVSVAMIVVERNAS